MKIVALYSSEAKNFCHFRAPNPERRFLTKHFELINLLLQFERSMWNGKKVKSSLRFWQFFNPFEIQNSTFPKLQ